MPIAQIGFLKLFSCFCRVTVRLITSIHSDFNFNFPPKKQQTHSVIEPTKRILTFFLKDFVQISFLVCYFFTKIIVE